MFLAWFVLEQFEVIKEFYISQVLLCCDEPNTGWMQILLNIFETFKITIHLIKWLRYEASSVPV